MFWSFLIMCKKAILIFLFILWGAWGRASFSAESTPQELTGVGIDEHLGASISLDLTFQNSLGVREPLRDFFDGKHPVILNLVYYRCPNVCHYLLDGFTNSVMKLPWAVGREFQVVTVSINPEETVEDAKKKRQQILHRYRHNSAVTGWHFLTGEEKNIRKLADEVGFLYQYDPQRKEYAHPSVIFVLTPDGKISRYLYGIQFNRLDLKLALLEAADGKIGSVVDKLLLYCYHYDPKNRKYALIALNSMKVAGSATVLGLIFLFFFLSRSRKSKKRLN